MQRGRGPWRDGRATQDVQSLGGGAEVTVSGTGKAGRGVSWDEGWGGGRLTITNLSMNFTGTVSDEHGGQKIRFRETGGSKPRKRVWTALSRERVIKQQRKGGQWLEGNMAIGVCLLRRETKV